MHHFGRRLRDRQVGRLKEILQFHLVRPVALDSVLDFESAKQLVNATLSRWRCRRSPRH